MIDILTGLGAILSWLTLSPKKGRGELQCAPNLLPDEFCRMTCPSALDFVEEEEGVFKTAGSNLIYQKRHCSLFPVFIVCYERYRVYTS